MLESFNLWYDRLGHVNFNSLCKLGNLNLLPNFHINPNHKCETCVDTKLAITPFHFIEKNTKPLELIHSDIYDLKFVQTR